MNRPHFLLLCAGLALLPCSSCSTTSAPPAAAHTSVPTEAPASALDVRRSELDNLSLVMKMADDYSAALGEAMQPIITSTETSATGRTEAQTFLRNGVGATLDIASGPNPDAAILDLLVLASLQHWVWSAHWAPGVIPDSLAAPAADRLAQAESDLWHTASTVLSDQQQQTLHNLIATWIKANPDRRLVSFVRFDQFTDIRYDPTLGTRTSAEGLFREVTQATDAVDQVRLLGERILWFAARYPHLIGQQAELSLYRSADQPEVRSVIASLDAVGKLSLDLSAKVDALDKSLDAQQNTIFNKLAAARTETIEQARTALSEVSAATLKDLESRLTSERKALFDDLDSRQGKLQNLLSEARTTADATSALARDLTTTAAAVDRIVARFDQDHPNGTPPLDLKTIRDAATEATKAAEKLTTLLEQTNKLADNPAWAQHLASLNNATSSAIDRAFTRGLILVLTLLAGLALLRLIPQRRPA